VTLEKVYPQFQVQHARRALIKMNATGRRASRPTSRELFRKLFPGFVSLCSGWVWLHSLGVLSSLETHSSCEMRIREVSIAAEAFFE
jgi:hypothetical protein